VTLADGAGFEILERADCLRLLASTDRGRIAIHVNALPIILPVRYVLDTDQVVFSTLIGGVLDRATDGSVVAFQADSAAAPESEWSVSLVGIARHAARPDDMQHIETLALPRWSPTRPHRFITVSTEQLAGRRSPDPRP
jgi:nitroimidazol reductase NimA-like FMN-containing flavoprotein (pyridoxamine 5'-phosphate oxidase superfamily)